MCLAIPGKVEYLEIGEEEIFRTGKVSFNGIIKDVDLSMVPEAKVGDYVLVHVGIGISVVDQEEAELTFEYLRQIGELDELEDQN